MKITAGRSDRFVPETHTPLWISARKLEALLKTAPTPLFVYDEKSLVRAVQALFAAFSWEPGFLPRFPVRMDPDPPVLRILRGAGCGALCRDGRELRLAAACGFAGPAVAYAPMRAGCCGGAAGAGARSRLRAGRAAGPPGLRAGSGCAASAAAGAAAYKRPPDHGRAGEQRGDGGGGAVPPGGLSARGRHADAWPWYVARRSVHGRGLLPRRLRAAGGRRCAAAGEIGPHGPDLRPWRRLRRQLPAGLPGAGSFRLRRRPSGRRRAHCRRPCRGCSCP